MNMNMNMLVTRRLGDARTETNGYANISTPVEVYGTHGNNGLWRLKRLPRH
jgi:hypothetical protein